MTTEEATLQDTIGRVLYDFMKKLDDNNAVMANVLHTEIINLSTSRTPLSEGDGVEALGIYVDVAVSRTDDQSSHNLIRELISSDSMMVDLDDRREATLNYFLVNPDLYTPAGNGVYGIQIPDNVPIVIGSYEDASLFEHEALSIDILRERKQDGVLSPSTYDAVKDGNILTFPVLILLSL